MRPVWERFYWKTASEGSKKVEMLGSSSNQDHQVRDVFPQNLCFKKCDLCSQYFDLGCSTLTRRLYSEVPGSWTNVYNIPILRKKNLFVDVVEDVANSRESRSTIGIKHGRSHNLKSCLDFIHTMMYLVLTCFCQVLHCFFQHFQMNCCTYHMSVLYPVRKALCQQKVPLKSSHLKTTRWSVHIKIYWEDPTLYLFHNLVVD